MRQRGRDGSVDVVIGGQFGSEGKGKICAYLAHSERYEFAVRSGGPNAAHTFYVDGHKYVTRHVPCASSYASCRLFVAAGASVSVNVLRAEIAGLTSLGVIERLALDHQAVIIEPDAASSVSFPYGTTSQGVGVAQAAKCLRRARLVRDASELADFRRTDTIPEIHALIDSGHRGLLEGVQGFGLGMNGPFYPYCTSRDTHAAQVVAECGVAPGQVSDIYLIIRSYPIRNAGNTGPMGADEISWDDVATRAGGLPNGVERGTIDQLPRRVSEFNWELVERAVLMNRPTKLALTFADHLSCADRGKTREADLSSVVRSFIDRLETRLQVPVVLVSTGPGNEMVERP